LENYWFKWSIDCCFGGLLYVVMQRQNIHYCKAYFGFGRNSNGQLDCRVPCIVPSFLHVRSQVRLCLIREKIPSLIKTSDTFRAERIRVTELNQGEVSDEDDDLCPAECVKEFKTDEEFSGILEKAKEMGSLVVVDFYRTSCGSCKYIEQGFVKLCKGSGDQEAAVIFLKHNVSVILVEHLNMYGLHGIINNYGRKG
jgi:hypothetical protein